MPKNKDLKRVVRTRMEKTGESYTAARAQVLSSDKVAAVPLAELAGMSDEAVAARTGKRWAEWVEALDALGAASMEHRDIAARVAEEYALDGWWAQTVTVGYERIRGLRAVGQRRDGSFEASKSKTFPVRIERLYEAFVNDRERERWVGDVAIEVRTCKPPRSVRWGWPDGTPVQAWFTAKGADKAAVQIQHGGLPDKPAVEQAKQDWGERLKALAKLLSRAD